jgi:hypothetical protein
MFWSLSPASRVNVPDLKDTFRKLRHGFDENGTHLWTYPETKRDPPVWQVF